MNFKEAISSIQQVMIKGIVNMTLSQGRVKKLKN